jgi:hypothetical protein
LSGGNKISLAQSSILAIPANLRTLEAIEAGKYERFNAEDFVNIEVYLYHNIFVTSGVTGPLAQSNIVLNTNVAEPGNVARKLETLRELPLRVRIAGMGQTTGARMATVSYSRGLSIGGTQTILNERTGSLVKPVGTIQISDERTNFKLFEAPLSILLSEKPAN